jgi:hypothetical protein
MVAGVVLREAIAESQSDEMPFALTHLFPQDLVRQAMTTSARPRVQQLRLPN